MKLALIIISAAVLLTGAYLLTVPCSSAPVTSLPFGPEKCLNP